MTTVAEMHDCLLLDLDGTVFRGNQPTTGAVDALAALEARALFVTNNASRGPDEVAEHLLDLGFRVSSDDIITSAQSAARRLASQLSSGSAVLVVGTESLAAEVSRVGLNPVRVSLGTPAAVVQGHSPQTGWNDLAEAALAIRAGALWVATNGDLTLPSERGLVPGNGSMVAALRAATSREPLVTGKPSSAIIVDALTRGDFASPLVVGDRLDTDIAGASAAGLPGLLVMTGVSTALAVVRAASGQRPDYIAPDLRSLHDDVETLRIRRHRAWRVDVGLIAVKVHHTGADPGDSLSVVRSTARAVWDAGIDSKSIAVTAGDEAAREAMERWSLLTPPDGQH